jgi:serpin B
MASKTQSVRTAISLVLFGGALALAVSRGGCTEPNARSELERDPAPGTTVTELATLVAGNTAFAIDLYRTLGGARAGQNIFFSPYSISAGLTMAYAGAGGKTATEMATVMHHSLPRDRLHRVFGALDLGLASREEDGVVLENANSLWGSEKTQFEKPFLDDLALNYGAGVRLADFRGDPDGSRKRINAWISEGTGDKIHDMLGPKAVDASTRIVLVNAVYFYGHWLEPFERRQTRTKAFSRLQGDPVRVPMMHADLRTTFSQSAAYDALELRYRGDQMAMDIVMPKAGTFAAFESGLTGQSLEAIIDGMKGDDVEVWVPRFTVSEASTSIKDALRVLGMSLAFDPLQADFSHMATNDPGGPLFLGDALQGAYLAVDEEGTRAASASSLSEGVGAAAPPQIAIRIDNPFFFVVRHIPTAAIVFAGRVTDPTHP